MFCRNFRSFALRGFATLSEAHPSAKAQTTSVPTESTHSHAQTSHSTKINPVTDPLHAAASKAPNQYANVPDEDLLPLIEKGKLKFFNLENDLEDLERAVRVRRLYVESKTHTKISGLPHEHLGHLYEKVQGQCCENVIGAVPIPVGVAGPLIVDGKEYFVPMATTEGALIASTTRGCKALSMCGGTKTRVVRDGMSRGPVLSTPSIEVASAIKEFVESPEGFQSLCNEFAKTSRFARIKSIKATLAGRKIFLRFTASSGDAMGMNMVGKGVDQALKVITDKFPSSYVLALSGNYCTDKKPAAINWIEGRGKSVVVEANLTEDVVKSVLKTSIDGLLEVNYAKNLVGSAMAGSIGGYNAHASNIVTACFLATGQDPAQNVESSNCMTLFERNEDGSLYMSVTMPSIEVGTVGGGTSLPGQSAMLSLLGVKGSNNEHPGQNAQTLARVIASTVMAGELSLISALSSGHLISSHMKLNRKGGTKH